MTCMFIGPNSCNPTPVTGPFGSPVHCVVSPDHISEQLPGPSTAPMRTSSEDVSGAPLIVLFFLILSTIVPSILLPATLFAS